MPTYLSVTAGPDHGRNFLINPGSSTTVGRASTSKIHLTDHTVSRQHFRLEVGDSLLVLHNESVGGTLVNGIRIHESCRLSATESTKIQVGNTSLLLQPNVPSLRSSSSLASMPPANSQKEAPVKRPSGIFQAVQSLGNNSSSTFQEAQGFGSINLLHADAGTPLPGYRLERLLSRSQSATVWVAQRLSDTLREVWKLLPSHNRNPGLLIEEARRLGNIANSYLIAPIAATNERDCVRIVYPFIEGRTLTERSADPKDVPLCWQDVQNIVFAAAVSLVDIHRVSLKHGRLDSDHILIRQMDGQPFLLGLPTLDSRTGRSQSEDIEGLGRLLRSLLGRCPQSNDQSIPSALLRLSGRLTNAEGAKPSAEEVAKELQKIAPLPRPITPIPPLPAQVLNEGNPIPILKRFPFLNPPETPGGEEIGRFAGYSIRRLIGQGSSGLVFEGFDAQLERAVAVKVLRPEIAQRPENRAAFVLEARAMAKIHSPNVVVIHSLGMINTLPYIVMECLEGLPLSRLLEDHPRLGLKQSIHIAREAALGLIAAHAKGVIHRDISPANLWLEPVDGRYDFPRVKLVDFGLADRPKKHPSIVGTPGYLAPEAVNGKQVTNATDLFSLGCVLYHMIAGRPPFPSRDDIAALMVVPTKEHEPLWELVPEARGSVADLVDEMLAKVPVDRPKSAQEVAFRLRQVEQRLMN